MISPFPGLSCGLPNGADRQSPGKTSASAKEEGPARGPRRRKEKIKSAGKQVIFPLTKKTTFVRFIEVLKKRIFLPSVNCSFGGGNVAYLFFVEKDICHKKGGEGE